MLLRTAKDRRNMATAAMSISVGSVVPTRTLMACCASTSRKGWICRISLKASSMPSRGG